MWWLQAFNWSIGLLVQRLGNDRYFWGMKGVNNITFSSLDAFSIELRVFGRVELGSFELVQF